MLITMLARPLATQLLKLLTLVMLLITRATLILVLLV